MPLLTKTPWFGPRRMPGWGWTPVTWQGWVVSVAFMAAIVAAALLVHGGVLKIVIEVVLVVLLLAVSFLTGTRPGWRSW
jgi:hypothetical protein